MPRRSVSGPQRLTLTFGFGPSLFGVGGEDRFGFGQRRPAKLSRLPVFSGDVLEDQRSDGDLCVQACAENPQVAFHAIHVLARAANGVATLRWSQDGFGRTSSTSQDQPTPRNLIGFKDGTNNIRAEPRNCARGVRSRGRVGRGSRLKERSTPDFIALAQALRSRPVSCLI
ncbi:MAG TPA: Dyp-type peroxidase domain-containing protein [Solirubrobacterales bacterium]|nr:Dyp-type peroxidase domain-containing protein [Solirubrobacterales bacterium]